MTSMNPAPDRMDPVAELQEALTRIRTGAPLGSELQNLFHCAYLAGCVDSRRESLRHLAGEPGFALASARDAEYEPATEPDRASERVVQITEDVEPSLILNPREWIPGMRHAVSMDRQSARRGLVLVAIFAAWCVWWLTR